MYTRSRVQDNLLCCAGGIIRAHEFHYAQSDDNGDAFRAEKPNGRAWDCVHASEALYAGFPHLYFRANPAFAQSFVCACAQGGNRYEFTAGNRGGAAAV